MYCNLCLKRKNIRIAFSKHTVYVFGLTRLLLMTQNVKSARNMSTINSNTSNIIATDIPRYNDKDPPIAPVRAVIC